MDNENTKYTKQYKTNKPLIRWWVFKYKNFFLNTYHTPHETGFERYIDFDQFIQLRKNLKMSQKEFSKFLGISTRSVCRIENGHFINLNLLNKLKKVLGKSKWTWTY